ncbi:retrovirus-related pol polyprotein from transposon TNT 1-94 [Tanacetum coccineum]
MLTEREDGIASIKQRRHDLRSDGVSTLVSPSEHGRPKGTLEDSVFYCQGKDNGVNILKSINEGTFVFPKTRDTVTKGVLEPKRDKLLQGLPKDIYTLINHHTTVKDIWDNVQMILEGRQQRGQGNNPRGANAAGNGGVQNRGATANTSQANLIKCYNCNRFGHIARNYTQPKRPQNSDYFKDKMLLMQVQENGVVLDDEQLLFLADGYGQAYDDEVNEELVQDLAQNRDNNFQADQIDAFDSDINEAPTA